MSEVDPRAVMAARNNADLYRAVFDAQGLRYQQHSYAFAALDKPPPFYANVTVIEPGFEAEITQQLQTRAASMPGALVVKDSHCTLDPDSIGFKELFSASWIWRAPAATQPEQGWERVQTEADLTAWEASWKASSPTDHHMFPPALLNRPDLAFLGRRTGGTLTAGCIANRSADCIGLSNVFSQSAPEVAFAEATTATAALAPDLPVVGYESGSDLSHAKSSGFEVTSNLRILKAQ